MIGLLFVVNVAVTIFDTTSKSKELDSSILRFFSMKRSLEIFIRPSKSKNMLSSFDGVRAISMTWVVLGSGLLLCALDGTKALSINRERHLVSINMKGFLIRALVWRSWIICSNCISINFKWNRSIQKLAGTSWRSSDHKRNRFSGFFFINFCCVILIPTHYKEDVSSSVIYWCGFPILTSYGMLWMIKFIVS